MFSHRYIINDTLIQKNSRTFEKEKRKVKLICIFRHVKRMEEEPSLYMF